MSKINKTKIDWCDYSFNPLYGCKNNCEYCYAKNLNNRFKFCKVWEQPEYFPEKLEDCYLELKNKKTPLKVFIGSMSDMWGKWVDTGFIQQVIDMCANIYKDSIAEHEFMFLTKNPFRYHEFAFPKNCWLGTTIESKNQLSRLEILKQYFLSPLVKKFVSIEPIMGDFEGVDFTGIDLVIVGAMTKNGTPVLPPIEWIKSIKHDNIFYKESLNGVGLKNK